MSLFIPITNVFLTLGQTYGWASGGGDEGSTNSLNFYPVILVHMVEIPSCSFLGKRVCLTYLYVKVVCLYISNKRSYVCW